MEATVCISNSSLSPSTGHSLLSLCIRILWKLRKYMMPHSCLQKLVWADSWSWELFSSFHSWYKRDLHKVLNLCWITYYINSVFLCIFYFPWAIFRKICFEVFSLAQERGGFLSSFGLERRAWAGDADCPSLVSCREATQHALRCWIRVSKHNFQKIKILILMQIHSEKKNRFLFLIEDFFDSVTKQKGNKKRGMTNLVQKAIGDT